MDLRELVETKLRNYRADKHALELLKIDVDHFRGLTCEEVIESMAFHRKTGELVKTSNVPDRTGNSAMLYRETTDTINKREMEDMMKQYSHLKHELDILESCINSLDDRHRDVIKDLYLNNKTWQQLCNKYYVSKRNRDA